ncbi:MAG: restriction endonuclease subunit S [Saprospiraceae bacterium]
MSWQKVKLGKVCFIEKGTTGIQKAIPGKYPLVVTSEERKSHNEFQFDSDAVIIPLVSSTGHGHRSLKRIHFQQGKFALGSILCAVIPKDKTSLSAEYLYRFLDLNKENELVSRMRGMANVTLPLKEIAEIEIPLPSLKDQHLFVEKYKNLENQSQFLSTELTHQLHLVQKLRQQLLQEAVQGKLVPQDPSDESASILLQKIKAEKERLVKEKKIKKDKDLPEIKAEEIPFEIPEGWVWCRLGEICSKIGSGSTPKGSNYSKEGVPFFRSQNVYDEGLVYDDITLISPEVHTQMAGTIVYATDILLNITGGSMGRCALVPNEFEVGNVSQHVCIIRPVGVVNSFYHIVVRSPFFQKFILSSTTGAGREGLPKYNLEQFIIPLPPLAEQHRIVQKLEQLLQVCDTLQASIQESRGYNEQLLQQVLREALKGE